MKVWVIWNEDENRTIEGIFSTEEKELVYINSLKERDNSEKNIEEFELDHLLKNK